ncbi:hypothetical protein GFU48_25175, partial [Escherichia coli]|nr:hypothetical protein [Escherichia coli]MQR47619.1 hypothetical protein [Escherichia coli]
MCFTGAIYPVATVLTARRQLHNFKPHFNTPVNHPGFPGEYFICELRLPDHCFRWRHNKLFLFL